jgi:hypothetical protein
MHNDIGGAKLDYGWRSAGLLQLARGLIYGNQANGKAAQSVRVPALFLLNPQFFS